MMSFINIFNTSIFLLYFQNEDHTKGIKVRLYPTKLMKNSNWIDVTVPFGWVHGSFAFDMASNAITS